MKLNTVLKHMSRIKMDNNRKHGIDSVTISRHEKVIVMDGPEFFRLFPDHVTEPHYRAQKYVMRQGVRICTYAPDPNSDEADTRQEVRS